MERRQLWPSPLRFAIAVLLSLSLSSSWAAPLLLQLNPSSESGMACCKRSSAHSCCKKKTPDSPAIAGQPPCGDACNVRVSPAGPSMQTILAPGAARVQAIVKLEEAFVSSPRVSLSDFLSERYQRPPPLA